MIRISKKTDYAIFLMGYLARKARLYEAPESAPSSQGGGSGGDSNDTAADTAARVELVSAHDLASLTTLNRSVVANLLKDLTRAGLLTSVRGVHGGYRLARSPELISLAEILEALEGPFALIDCGTVESDDEDCGCSLSSFCTTRRPLQVLQDRIIDLINNLKVTELCGLDEHNRPEPFPSLNSKAIDPGSADQNSADPNSAAPKPLDPSPLDPKSKAER